MAIENLSFHQGAAFQEEMISTRNLLGYGIHVMRTNAFIATTRDPILTMLSIGLEKLYKLTIGLDALNRGGEWPSRETMRDFKHDLTKMHGKVMGILTEGAKTKSQYVRELVHTVESDPVVRAFIHTLSIYGRQGRFYSLDQLANHQQAEDPDEAWNTTVKAARTDPEVAEAVARWQANIGDDVAVERAERAQHDRMATAIENIWLMAAGCGANGVLGPAGEAFGSLVHPDAVGRQ